MTQEQRLERNRRIRKRIHEAVPACVAVVDHGDFIGAYVYPEDLDEAKKIIAKETWEGVSIRVRLTPPLSLA